MVYNFRNLRIAPKSIFLTVGLVLLLSVLVARGFPAQVGASPEATNTGISPLGIISLVTAVGDDAFATTDLAALAAVLDPAHWTQHYGPYASGSPDSGTCGNDWATDTFNRHFTVFFNSDGTVSSIVEQFKDGSFVTPAPPGDLSRTPNGPSPGACESSPIPAGIVDDGITGSLHGYFIINVPPGTTETSSDSHCDAVAMSNENCFTSTFIDSHFSCTYLVDCTVSTYFDHYVATGQGLIIGEWKNASNDRGGNHGDIRSSNLP